MGKCYAMVLESPSKFVEKEFKLPTISPDGILLRVEMVSICGSDRHLYDGTHAASSFPKILGHEVVGFVEELGEVAANIYGIKQGERVTVEPYIMCKNCEYCLTGYYFAHKPRQNYGVSLKCNEYPYLLGGYSEFMYIKPGSKLHKINKDIKPEAACLSSVIGNGIRWVRTKAKVKIGETVAIFGVGAQGLATVIAAKESGAYPIIIIGISKDNYKFKLAKEFGADYTINIEKDDPVRELERITNGRMAEVVIECTGIPAVIRKVFSFTRPEGRIVLVGLTGGKEINIITDKIVNDEINVIGGHGQSWDVEDAVKLINSKKYPIERIITHKFSLREVEKAMNLFLEAPENCIRVGLIP